MNELDKQWQEDVEKYINPEKMWEYLGINNEWIDVPSPESMAVLPYVRRKESAALKFDKIAASAGDKVEVLIHGEWVKFDYQSFQPVFDCEDDDEDYSFTFPSGLRMKHPRRVGVDYSAFED